MVITSFSQQAVLNISSSFKDSGYFAYIVANSIGCFHLHEANIEIELKFLIKKKKVFLTENPQIIFTLKDHLILSEAHNAVAVWQSLLHAVRYHNFKGNGLHLNIFASLKWGDTMGEKSSSWSHETHCFWGVITPWLLVWESYSLSEKLWS